MAQVFEDSISVSLDHFDYHGTGSQLLNVRGSSTLKWKLYVDPIDDGNRPDHYNVYIKVVGCRATVSGTFYAVDKGYRNTDYEECFKYEFNGGEKYGIEDFFNCRCERNAEITCEAKFTWYPPKKLAPISIHQFIDLSNPDSCDAVIKVGEKDIKVPRAFLSIISSFFKAKFDPDTEETKTGIIEIADFTHETVKNALDYCYGHNVEQKTTSEINDMICFYEKFNIQPPIENLQTWLKEKSASNDVKPANKSSSNTKKPCSTSTDENDELAKKPTVQLAKRANKSIAKPAKRTKK